MSLPSGVLAVLLPAVAGAALLIWPDRLPSRVRGSTRWAPAVPQRWRPVLSAFGAGAAVIVTVPRWWWAGIVLAAAVGFAQYRMPARPSTAQRIADRAELAGRLDLIGACLRSGLGTPAALAAVADSADSGPGRDPVSLPGHPSGSPGDPAGRIERPVVRRDNSDGRPDNHPGTRRAGGAVVGGSAGGSTSGVEVLERVRSLLAVGADTVTAWRPALEQPDLATVAAAACRSSSAGTVLADAFFEQAAVLRATNSEAMVRSAGRAGVLMTAPLGACFLPAFLCLGLAPAVVGLLGTLSVW